MAVVADYLNCAQPRRPTTRAMPFLSLSNISSVNTVLTDEAGKAQYRVSTPHQGGTTSISVALPVALPSSSQDRDLAGYSMDSIPADATLKREETRFVHLAQISFHESHIKLKSTITFRGEERVVNDWLRKDGAGKGWWGPHRPFTGSDGKEYKWLLKANHCELRTNDAAESMVACFHPRKDRLFSKGKQPARLELVEGYDALRDEIVVTFVFLEHLRGMYDRGEAVA
ncbi:hypothetical protein MKEN_01358700 [Mycena kentingensis (nom. inval.)]|nr:hypothetical protein MKEN_01358700 [Mycena kentingensis (nom. inval.)]